MISTQSKKREPADPNLEREIAIKGAMRRPGLNGRRIVLKHGFTAAVVTETIQGTYASARVRSVIAAEIRETCAARSLDLSGVGLTPPDFWEE